MGHQIVLDVPDEVYLQAQAVAQRTQQSVEAVLVHTLEETLSLFPIDPQRDAMLRQEHLFESQRKELLTEYAGQFVAVREGAVLDADANEWGLIQRVQAAYPRQLVLVRQVTHTPPAPLRFRSPRFVRDS